MGYNGPTLTNPPSGDASIWEFGYTPSLAMGIVGVITYLVLAGPHLWWFVKMLGTRSVHGLLFFACLIELLGYGGRLANHRHPFGGMSFLIGITLVQLGTILITAALYKAIQRAIKYTPDGRKLSPMRPRSMLTLFIILDVVFVLLQIAGQYFAAGARSAEVTDADPMFTLGTSTLIYLGGNVLQAITIIIVSVFTFIILRRSTKHLANADPTLQYPLLKQLITQVLISFILFFIRLLVRIAEGAQGAFGYAMTHEWVFGVFEYLPLVSIIALWAAKPLWKFIFPLGHKHGEGAHTHPINAEEAARVNGDITLTKV